MVQEPQGHMAMARQISNIILLDSLGRRNHLTSCPTVVPHLTFCTFSSTGDEGTWTRREELLCLGILIDRAGNTLTSVRRRLALTTKPVYPNKRHLFGQASAASKLQARATSMQTCALHGSRTWFLIKEVLVDIRKWELGMPRKTLNIKRIPAPPESEHRIEHPRICDATSAKFSAHVFDKARGQMSHWKKALMNIVCEGWKGTNSTS